MNLIKDFNKAINLLLIAALLFSLFGPASVLAVGETEVDSWTDLDNIRNGLDGNYLLTRNLTAADPDYAGIGDNFTPIGPSFEGTFNGGGFQVQNLAMTGLSGNAGLFDTLTSSATVSNLSVTNVNFNFDDSAAVGEIGVLAAINNGSITNCSSSGTLSSLNSIAYDMAGLVAWNTPTGTVTSSSSDVTVAGDEYVAGLVGYNEGAISSSHSSGAVAATSLVGGLVGYSSGSIESSYSVAAVSGQEKAGGLVGSAESGSTIIDSYASGALTLTGTLGNSGGLVGSAAGTISGSYATGSITAPSSGYCLGGLTGNDQGASTTDSYATGDIIAPDAVDIGGLIGCLNASSVVSSSYATGDVTGKDFAGGLAGYGLDAEFINVFATGTVNVTLTNLGGIVGEGVPTTTNAHWFKQEEVGATNCYLGGNTGCTSHDSLSYFKGTSAAEPMTSWDFTAPAVWKVVANDYPILDWQEDPIIPDTTAPTFANLPGTSTPINITEGQYITTNPFVIKVKPTDGGGISKVEFSVDNNLLCTDTAADNNGVYDCSWDTSKYHSQVKVVAYDVSNNASVALIRNAVVDPTLYLTVLPKTGR